MMRSQNSDQPPIQNDTQKKSVFDRLGRQLDNGRQMKRRPSPGHYGDYGPPPSMHDPDYGRYSGRDGRSQADMEWRYQNERRMLPPFPGRDRHLPPPPMQHSHQPPPPSHYDMELGGRQPPPYYPHPNSYHAVSQGGMPAPMPPGGGMPMTMHQQRSSPKYDRMLNVGPNFKHRSGSLRMNPMDHNPCISPPRNFLPPNSAPPHLGPHDMPPIAPDGSALFPNSYRWPENVEPEYMMNHGARVMEEQFEPVVSRRYKKQHAQQLQQQNQASNPQSHSNEAPRYTRWRERRDVITNLDKETARSSSRTDSLKSTLQQSDSKNVLSKTSKKINNLDEINSSQNTSITSKNVVSESDPEQHKRKTNVKNPTEPGLASEKNPSNKEPNQKNSSKADNQDISDGEIIDDEDSSDDDDQHTKGENISNRSINNYQSSRNRTRDIYRGNMESQHNYENGKKRRLIEREDYAMDYETISDEDLDDFMGDKKMSDEDVKLCNRNGGDKESKSSSEIELLHALGLDWANLVEIAKQSKTSTRETSSLSPRFSVANYLPTLGITADLAGPELYDLVIKNCRTGHDHYQ